MRQPLKARQVFRHKYNIAKSIDEIALVCECFKDTLADQLAIDIGFHVGESSATFVRCASNVLAFEPNTSQSNKAPTSLLENPKLKLCPYAISDTEGTSEFFLSGISTGVSSLNQIVNVHNNSISVETKTLISALRENNCEEMEVGVLKMDVEGYELEILKTIDFESVRPNIVISEFEDSKSYRGNLNAQVQLLLGNGYRIVLSVWKPIIQYGISHEWEHFVDLQDAEHAKIVTSLLSGRWGNIIAFRSGEQKESFLSKAPF